MEYNQYPLYDLAEWKNGLAFKKIHFSNTGRPIIKIAELKNGITSSTAFTQGEYDSAVKLQKGDMLFSWSGNPETSIDVFWYSLPDGWLNQHIFKVSPKRIVDRKYLYYLLKYLKPKFTAIASNKQTTGLGHVTIKDLKEILVDLPPFPVQQAIGNYLTVFDDKIELNQKVNNNLQQQAQALFESWFIEYDPWSRIQPSEWTNAPLGTFVEIKRGSSPRPIQNYLSDSGLRWLKISDVTSLNGPFVLEIKEHIKESGLKKTVFLSAGELVLSNSATPGIPKILDVDTCIHDGWLYFPKSELSKYYLYLFFKCIRKELVALGNGSVFTNLKTDILKAFPVIKADEKTLKEFDALVIPLFETMLNMDRENAKLTLVRDSLLPKLMSGEIDL